MTLEWLLSGVETHETRSNPALIYAVEAKTEAGELLTTFNSFDPIRQDRLLGYAQALSNMRSMK